MRANPWSFHRLSDLTSHGCLLGITCLVTKFIIIIIIIISTWQTHMYRTRRLTSLDLIVIPEYLMIMICISTKTFYLHFMFVQSLDIHSVQRVEVLVLQIWYVQSMVIYTIPWANQCRQEPHMSLLESWNNCNMPCVRRGGKKARSLTQYIKLWIINHPSLPATS